MNRLRLFLDIVKLGKNYCLIIFSVIGYISIFFPFSNYLDQYDIFKKFLISILIVCATYTISCCIAIIFRKSKVHVFSVGNKNVTVEYGDILSDKILRGTHANVVIPADTCFTMELNERIVSSQTLHGKITRKIINEGFMSQEVDESVMRRAVAVDVANRSAADSITIAILFIAPHPLISRPG